MESVTKTGKKKKIKRTLGIRRFDSVLFASALESIVSILIAMSDTAITGHIVGEKGLSAMNVVSPIISFTIFLEGLFSVGTCMLYSRYLGRFEKEATEKTFGMGLEITALTGIIMFLLVKLSLPFYTRFLGIHGEVLDNVNLYMRFLSIKMMISPLFALVSQMVLTDGAEYLSMDAFGDECYPFDLAGQAFGDCGNRNGNADQPFAWRPGSDTAFLLQTQLAAFQVFLYPEGFSGDPAVWLE